MKRAIAVAAIIAIAVGGWALVRALQPSGGEILISGASVVPVTGEPGTARVFLTIESRGAPDRLVSASSAEAGGAELVSPELVNIGGATSLPVPGPGTPSLSADGAYILLRDITGNLAPGRLLPVSLGFADAGDITIKPAVAAAKTGTTDPHGAHKGMAAGNVPRPGEPQPTIAIGVEEAPDGTGWDIRVTTDGFAFRKDLADGAHVPGTGHGHLYADGLKLMRLYGDRVRIGALPPGRVTLRVTLNTNDHRAYVVDGKPVSAVQVVEVAE